MAALSASRLVCSAISVMRWTIEPIWLDLPSRPDMASEAEREESRTAFIAVVAWIDGLDALAGQLARLRGRVGGLAGGVGGRVDGLAPSRRPSAVALATMRSWASAPVVISVIAPAISATARPDSSEVRVTASEEVLTVVAVATTSPIISRRLTVMRLQGVAERVVHRTWARCRRSGRRRRSARRPAPSSRR